MAEIEITISEAEVKDAKGLLELLNLVPLESDFLTRDKNSAQMNLTDMETFIERRAFLSNEICILARSDQEVIGVINVSSSEHDRISHIGDIFIAVKKAYWGYGIGKLLMEAVIDWAEHSHVIRRLELEVQVRNEKAVHVYEKFGFEIESTKKRGAKSKNGEFIDVYAMARLID